TWTGERTITDGARTLKLFTVGPNPHCEETVFAYVPEAGVVYQGDMLIAPRTGDVPAGAALTRVLDEFVRAHKLAVKVIAGTHGRVASPDDLAAALRPR